jgi:hypothetical protein
MIMKIRFYYLVPVTLLLILCNGVFAQDVNGTVSFHIQSSHTSFPDTGRSNGHTYDKVLYTTADHYQDSTVLIIAPKDLNVKEKIDLVFWFHGWHNNVDNAAVYYELTKQFIASKRNAVLILAETAKDSPDSYGGKLENPGVFKALVADVMTGLKSQHLMPANCVPEHIVLAGHSGAYRVMARIIKNGQMPVDQAMLFDALYAETEIFIDWIKADQSHRFIDLYTDHGGTDGESHAMVKLLAHDQVPYIETEEANVTPQLLNSNRLIYIHSAREHNEIINKPDNFRLFLENNPFLKSIK